MSKTGRINLIFRKVVLIIVFLLTAIIFLESCLYIEGQKSFLLKPGRNAAVVIIPGIILFSGMLLLLFNRIDRIRQGNEKRVICVLWSMIILIQTIIVYFLIKEGFKGITDTSRVINEAIAMVESQNGLINNEAAYFARYGNNYSFTILIYYICKIIHSLGFRCYTAVLMVLNVLLINLSGVFSFKIVKLLRGTVSGIKFLILLVLSPTTYIWILFTYTNTFSMPFIMGLLYYGIRAMRCEQHRIKNIVIASIIGAVGYQIRATTIIPLIAILLGIFLTMRIRSGKEKICMLLLVAGIFIGVMLATSFLCRTHIVNRESDKTFPFTHWVMMGLNVDKNGFVNNSDVNYSMSLPTKQEKIKGNVEKIKERLSKMGPVGYVLLVAKKLEYVWGAGGDGSLGFYSCGENITGIYQYFYGDKNGLFCIYSQVFRSITFMFALYSVFFQLRKKGLDEFFMLSLTVLGAILFFIIWETNHKYNICFMNLLYILMGDGINCFAGFTRQNKKMEMFLQKKWCRQGVLMFILVIPLAISTLMLADFSHYIQKKSEYHRVALSVINHKAEYISLKKNGDVMEQTFITDQNFNKVYILCKESSKWMKDNYLLQLLDEKGDDIGIRQISEEVTEGIDGRWICLHLDEIPAVQKAKRFTIRVVCLKNQKKGISLAITPYDMFDLYEDGSLKLNHTLSNRDMAFCVVNSREESLISTTGYIIFGLTVWVFSGILVWKFYKRLRVVKSPQVLIG